MWRKINGEFSSKRLYFQKRYSNGKTALHISQLGDISYIFVNGKKAGESQSRVHPVTIDLKSQLIEGKNNIMIVTDNYDMYVDGGMGFARITYPETYGIQPVEFQYSEAKGIESFNDLSAGVSGNEEKSLIKWVKIQFTISENKIFWMPYFMTLETILMGKYILMVILSEGVGWEALKKIIIFRNVG